jgi:hypothetical protein
MRLHSSSSASTVTSTLQHHCRRPPDHPISCVNSHQGWRDSGRPQSAPIMEMNYDVNVSHLPTATMAIADLSLNPDASDGNQITWPPRCQFTNRPSSSKKNSTPRSILVPKSWLMSVRFISSRVAIPKCLCHSHLRTHMILWSVWNLPVQCIVNS